ncbi:glycosyltransferase [Streptomyces alkaliphilus]|uniref:Glycosyltransferase n=1 Tax=Streptomyces alkaliphilus TaxID=1472722 RepID=A0A7W3T9P1_9ACTN|nr:glycosyltransferase [Streptomyces alkaliphilus]MBB0242838.1 glycosyltransferase [Streptomyces alkaliphilus]
MATPDVSVIIGAYNAMPYLTRSVQSVLDQTIGSDRIELIAVNDGSTDDTGDELDRFAKAHPSTVRVIHQENSGGPAKPRNVGLSLATGRYVFFLDADDYLGPEALDRMVTMADENNTDVVLGKMVGVGGRGAPKSMFRQDQPKTDVFSSRAYWTLNPMKLFRRELIEQHNLRFPTDMKTGEDQLLVGPAMIHAAGISILSSYDCVYWVTRDDGGNTTVVTGGAAPRVIILSRMLPLAGELVKEGSRRDHLFARHIQFELTRALGWLLREPNEGVSRALFDELHAVISQWDTAGAVCSLSAIVRLQHHLVREGRFEESLAVLRYMEEDPGKLGGKRPGSGMKMLPSEVSVRQGKIFAHYPFFRDASLGIPDDVYDITREVTAGTWFDAESLTIEWCLDERGTLLVRGKRKKAPYVDLELVAESDDGVEIAVPIEDVATPGREGTSSSFVGRFPLSRSGVWSFSIRIAGTGMKSVPVKRAPGSEPLKWWHYGVPRYAVIQHRNGKPRVRVDRVRPLQGVRRRLSL